MLVKHAAKIKPILQKKQKNRLLPTKPTISPFFASLDDITEGLDRLCIGLAAESRRVRDTIILTSFSYRA